MKKVLLTGATGFVGKNILPLLQETAQIYAPRRSELDLMDVSAIQRYLSKNAIDVVVHSANPNPVKNARCDSVDRVFEDSLRMFMSFYALRDECEKVIYLGSGAEYDKRLEIAHILEEDVHRSLPADAYGLSKAISNDLAAASENVFNLRLFACYGPYDHESKFITHCIRCIMADKDISMRQNCLFDYLHVSDLGRVIAYCIDHELAFHDYNVASGQAISLVDIAQQVIHAMGSARGVTIEREGMNREYTACVDRLNHQTNLVESFLTLDAGIERQICFERHYAKEGMRS